MKGGRKHFELMDLVATAAALLWLSSLPRWPTSISQRRVRGTQFLNSNTFTSNCECKVACAANGPERMCASKHAPNGNFLDENVMDAISIKDELI
jgi:hypothetical protein